MKIDPETLYSLLKQIPRGKITTYKILADALQTKAYRRIGQILKNNPNAPIVPCHRVVKSDGSIGGYMGKTCGTDWEKKRTLLIQEGIQFDQDKIKNFGDKLFIFL